MSNPPPGYSTLEEKGGPPEMGFQQSDYNSWSQSAGYVNPTYPSTQQPNYHQPVTIGHANAMPMGYMSGQPGNVIITSAPPPQPLVFPHIQETSTTRNANNVGAVVAIFVIILAAVGAATDYWIVNPNYHLGLWKVCGGKEIQICIPIGFVSGMFAAVQGLMILGILCLFPAVVLHCLLAWGSIHSKRGKATGAHVLYTITSIFLIVAVALAGSNFVGTRYVDRRNKLGWSYWLTIVSIVGVVGLNITVSLVRRQYLSCGKVLNKNVPQPMTVVS